MRIIIAPDSFKGSLSAFEAASAIAGGVKKVFTDAQITLIPLADGGEGTAKALLSQGGERREAVVTGPLPHMRVKAAWGIMPDGTAVIESAEASGLTLLAPHELDAGAATSYGTGELLKEALNAGARRIIIGLGGSAMTDGGTGLAAALGARFLDENGMELPHGGLALARLHAIDLSGLDRRLPDTQIIAATDVDNPLYGPNGAAYIFSPQKGADAKTVAALDESLKNYAAIAETVTGRGVQNTPGAGAAGGLGAGLLLFTRATIASGAGLILEALGFDTLLQTADLVITGEGKSDAQSARGKLPAAVGKAAKRHGVPVICISGALGMGYEALYACGIDAAQGCPAAPAKLDECMGNAAPMLEAAAERACRTLAVGMKLAAGRAGFRDIALKGGSASH